MNNENINSALDALKLALTADGTLTANSSVMFKDKISGKGMLWAGKDYTKQFVYQDDRLFSSESIDVSKGKNYSINNLSVLSETELGSSVVKSNLREVGRLKGLIVDGGISVNNYMVFDANSDRLGLGTDEPNAALSIVDEGVEIVLGATDYDKASVGTFNNTDLHIVTGNNAKIIVGSNGDIQLGNRNNSPISVKVHGGLGIGVNDIDPRVKLHVNGSVRFNDNVHLKGVQAPTSGGFTNGDIVWNSEPDSGKCIGWVCVKAGNPGVWKAFGEIR